jgi:hypothetical protein
MEWAARRVAKGAKTAEKWRWAAMRDGKLFD